MKIKLGIIFLLLVLTNGILYAGELSDELALRLEGKSDIEIIPVWIKMVDPENPIKLKNELKPIKDRHERYLAAMSRIKTSHANAQKELLNVLTSSRAKSISNMKLKGHWLVNIVEAELAVGDIKKIAGRSDIEKIFSVPEIHSTGPVEGDSYKMSPSKSANLESNISYINAPAVWDLGYTGEGRVVCSFDTGVDGIHPALYNNWKGLDGDSAAAWFDPGKHEAFPHDIPDCGISPCRSTHGTHVMGTMVGHDDNLGDTIGVAPDAKWISAAVIDIAGVSIIDGFEWAANPDGDPNTMGDVPDVINHSWGVIGISCEEMFYDMIDYTEALGIVNIFSAGNEGSTASTIRNPADRALTDIDCFAVGNLNHNTETIASSSSRGPSTCQPGAIKPNVVAPGYVIRSCVPNDGYSSLTGTSMAAPHVSGLVALMREKNPNATVDEIKTAILNSAKSLGQSIPNNDIGWGSIDCLAAINALSASNADPNVKVYSFDHPAIAPGDNVTGSLVLKNIGAGVASVNVSLVDNNAALTIVNGISSFGIIAEGDTVRGAVDLEVIVSDTVTPGTILSLDMNITGTGYNTTGKLYFMVEPKLTRSLLTHNSGTIKFSVSNFGTLGLGDFSFVPVGGAGFDYMNGGNDLFEGGLMISSALAKVSDGVRNIAGEPDGDFGLLPSEPFAIALSSDNSREMTSCRFNDDRAENPIGLEIIQNSYAFLNDPYQDAMVLEYIIKNNSGATLAAVDVGLYTDWDIPTYLSNAGGYDAVDNITWIAYNNGTSKSNYRGVQIIKGTTNTSYTHTADIAAFGGDGLTEFEKINILSDGLASATTYANGQNDLLQTTASRLVMSPGEIDTVTFAIVAGQTFPLLVNAAEQASIAYQGVITDVPDNGGSNLLPVAYALHQNYPNPFNPSTVISFDLPRASEYSLEIYNIRGQKVKAFEGFATAGTVQLEWDASGLASGIYLYKLTAGEFSDSKKMMLLK